MDKMKMIRLAIPEDDYNRMDAIAHEIGSSVPEFIRSVLTLYVGFDTLAQALGELAKK